MIHSPRCQCNKPEEQVGAEEAAQAVEGPLPAQRRRDAAAHRQPPMRKQQEY